MDGANVVEKQTGITIEKGAVTANFLYFFDTKTRITDAKRWPKPADDPEGICKFGFQERLVEKSVVLKSFFSERIPGSFIHIHFHTTEKLVRNLGLKALGIADTDDSTSESPSERIYPSVNRFGFSLPKLNSRLGYSPIECTLFRNGVLAVLIRLQNTDRKIEDERYLELIRRPERSDPSTIAAGKTENEDGVETDGGELIGLANRVLQVLEPKLVQFINALNIECTALGISEQLPLQLIRSSNPVYELKKKETRKIELSSDGGETRICHRLWSSRPHVGTVIQFRTSDAAESIRSYEASAVDQTAVQNFRDILNRIAQNSWSSDTLEKTDEEAKTLLIGGIGKVKLEYLRRFAISCARTDPDILKSFAGATRYFEDREPPRNIIYTGPSIFLISRRNWCCFNMHDQDQDFTHEHTSHIQLEPEVEEPFIRFRTGVIETVLTTFQAMHASVRAHRRFLLQVEEKGAKYGEKIDKLLANESKLVNDRSHLISKVRQENLGKFDRLIRRTKSLGPRFSIWRKRQKNRDDFHNEILKFTTLLGSMRSNSPIDEISLVLRSHLLTHTAISAVRRVMHLTSYEALTANTRETISNYESFLGTIDELWNLANDRITRNTLIVSVIVLVLTAVTLLATLLSNQ